MNEPWLRDLEGAWIPSPQKQSMYDLLVSDLMLPNAKMWDKGKIESLFPMHVASRISEVPLFDMLEDDKLVWVDSSNGHYNVRSGYKLFFNITGRLVHASHNENWTNLWNIAAPPKTKHLLWRFCKGCIPTRTRLQDKHVPCPTLCPLCNNDDETELHVLFNCVASMQVWHYAGLEDVFLRRVQNAANVQHVIHTICTHEEKEIAGRFAMTVWVLWNNRNNKVWNDVAEPGRSLGVKAKLMWDEWNLAQQQQPRQHITQQQHVFSWERPVHGWLKCNVDAAFHKHLNKTSSGWCLRDHMGRFIRAETTWMNGNCTIVEGESIALIKALHAMEQQGFSHVIFESDSKSVVDAINHLRGGSSEFSFLISLINNYLYRNPNFVVKFIKRQANMVAHTLARAAISWPCCCSFETLPICIANSLINEMI
jgi:ribonuclease HI